MTLTLPDDPALEELSEDELRLDLACALYASRRVSRSVGARVAGLEQAPFDNELVRRGISFYTEEDLTEDLSTLQSLFSSSK